MAPYAKGTSVPVTRSRDEIQRTLDRFGADQFAYAVKRGANHSQHLIGFEVESRQIRIELETPVDDEREERRLWRCLSMQIKARLVAIEEGISTLEREFMADIVLPNGQTLHQSLREQLSSWRGGAPLLIPERLGG